MNQGSIKEILSPDTLNEIGVLKRREIEARIIGPLIAALSHEFGAEHVIKIARETIIEIARQQGAQLAELAKGNSLSKFAEALENWKKDGALEIEVLVQTDENFDFNVTRCRYAEMYHALGVPELGEILSCNRDFALIEGFNNDVELNRTQTILNGAKFCDFRFIKRGKNSSE